MTQAKIQNVNIYHLPLEVIKISHNEITLGDLHGNTMKLIYALVLHGIISGLSATDYEKLVSLYISMDEGDMENVLEFFSILEKAEYSGTPPIYN